MEDTGMNFIMIKWDIDNLRELDCLPSVLYLDDEDEDMVDKLKNESLYCNDEVDTDSPMVTLSTCDLDYGLHSNRRLLLSGFLEEYDETIIVHS